MNQIGLDTIFPDYEKIPVATFPGAKTVYRAQKNGFFIAMPDSTNDTANYSLELFDFDPKNEADIPSGKALAYLRGGCDGEKDNSSLLYLAEVSAQVTAGQYIRFWADKPIMFRTFMAVPKGGGNFSIATSDAPGAIIPDGTTTKVDDDGKLSAIIPTISVDGTTIKKDSSGQLSAIIPKPTEISVDGTTIKKDSSGKLIAVQPTYLFAWDFILYIGWNSGGSYLLGTLDRGSAIRLRSTVFASPDCADVDAIEYNIWANSDATVIQHDMPRNTAANLSWFFNTTTNKFELYFNVPGGRHRYRNFWYQLLQGTFTKSGAQVAAPPSQMVAIQATMLKGAFPSNSFTKLDPPTGTDGWKDYKFDQNGWICVQCSCHCTILIITSGWVMGQCAEPTNKSQSLAAATTDLITVAGMAYASMPVGAGQTARVGYRSSGYSGQIYCTVKFITPAA